MKNKWLKRYFVDSLSGMALGLFSTLIIGLIIKQIGSFFPVIDATVENPATHLVVLNSIGQFFVKIGHIKLPYIRKIFALFLQFLCIHHYLDLTFH